MNLLFPPGLLFAITDFRLDLSPGIGWYILLAAISIAVSVAVYRFTLPPVSPARRSILWILRGLALVLILFLIFEPVISYLFQEQRKPAVALLVDRSASMSVQDQNQDRSAELKRFLSDSRLSSLNESGSLKSFAFSDTVESISFDSLATVPLNGVGTDPSSAWLRAEQVLAGENLSAIIVVSDGAQNLGASPPRVASNSTVPIFTVGIGDTTRRRDAVISEIVTNEIVYVGSKVPVDVRVRATGFSGQSSVVRLISPKGEIARQTVNFNNDVSELTVSMQFDADTAGDIRLTAVVDSLPNEVMLENNRRSVIVSVLDSRSQVFLFAGSPSGDVTALRQSLEKDTTLDVRVFIEVASGKYMSGKVAPDADEMKRANTIVMVDFPSANTSDKLISDILRTVQSGSAGLLFSAGPYVSKAKLEKLSEVLPITQSSARLSEYAVTLRGVSTHAMLSGATPLSADWADLPPVFGGTNNFTVGARAQVLAKLSRESLGITEDEPAVAVWELNRKRGVALLTWGNYRWKLGTAVGTNAEFYPEFISRVVSWLVAPVEQQLVKVNPTKRLYSGGETVRFVGQVYGADLTPRDDASLQLQISASGRTETVPMRSRGNGRYEAELSPWTQGDYAYSAVAIAGADSLGTDDGVFAIEAFNPEFIDAHARFDLLQQVSRNSNGLFVTATRPDSLFNQLNLTPIVRETRAELPLWNKALMLWIIVTLLTAEWTLRKRSGML